MKHTRYIVFLAFLSLLAAFSCDRRELDPTDPDEGKEPLVLVLKEGGGPMKVSTRSGDVSVVDTSFFRVETEDWPVEVETRAITEVNTNSLKNGNVVWGAVVGTSPASLWTPVRVTADSEAKVATGHYVGSNGGMSNTYYVANVSSASAMTLTTSGATLSVSNSGPAYGTDVVAGKATSSSANVNIQLEHAYARTGNLVLNAPSGTSVSNVYWYIESSGSNTGYAGTYSIDSGSWSNVSSLSSRALYSTSDYYLTPGDYQLTISYGMTLADGTVKYGITRTGTVSLEKGKVNNIVATAPDYTEHDLYIAWASSSGVVSGYQEVPAHGDIYVGGHATLQARLYTIRNGVLDTYDVIPNSQVTWSIPYDYSYISIDSSTGVLTGLSPHGTAGTYDSNSCYIHAEYTVDGQTYQANNLSKRAMVNVLPSPVSTTYRLAVTPNPGTLNVGRYGTYQVYRQELVNGVYSGNQVQIPNTDVTWSVQNTGIATVIGTGANAGRATGVAPGTTTVTVTLKNTAQYYSDYTSEGRTATATLNVVTSGGIDPGWTDPGSEIIL